MDFLPDSNCCCCHSSYRRWPERQSQASSLTPSTSQGASVRATSVSRLSAMREGPSTMQQSRGFLRTLVTSVGGEGQPHLFLCSPALRREWQRLTPQLPIWATSTFPFLLFQLSNLYGANSLPNTLSLKCGFCFSNWMLTDTDP